MRLLWSYCGNNSLVASFGQKSTFYCKIIRKKLYGGDKAFLFLFLFTSLTKSYMIKKMHGLEMISFTLHNDGTF
ncbi:hypothetical protein PATA110616_10195 [Paenibacillus tarimensis]